MNYHCNNCDHYWEGDDFTVECPNCKSLEIDIADAKADSGTMKVEQGTAKVQVDSQTQKFDTGRGDSSETFSSQSSDAKSSSVGTGTTKKKSRTPILIVVAILIIGGLGFTYFMIGDGSDDQNDSSLEEVKASIVQKENKFFLEGSIIKGAEEETLDLDKVNALYRSSDSLQFNFDKKTGQIFFCEQQEGHTALILDVDTDDTTKIETKSVKLSLFGKEPAENANCEATLKSGDIGVSFQKCNLIVSVKEKSRFDALDVSVTGENGTYQRNKFTWNISSMSKKPVMVWVKKPGYKPVAYRLNNQKQIPLCVKDNPTPEKKKSLNALKKDLAGAAAKFGINPRDRGSSKVILDITMNTLPGEPVFIVDGERIEGFSNFSSKLSIGYRNNGTQYVLVKEPEIVQNDHWKLTYRSK